MHLNNSLNAAAVIAAREIRERSRLFLVAGAMAAIPFLAALAPGAGDQRGTAIATVAGVLAVAYACSIALMQGVTVIGRDLSEKRLSFFFSKPIPPWTIWAGKAAAALFITALAGVIVAVPAFLLSPSRWAEVWKASGSTLLILTIATCLTVFFGGHAISTMLRSRSMLTALDAFLGAATLGAAFLIVRPLFKYQEPWLWSGLLAVMGCLILAILAVAPAGQLARGRADARRSHAALSRFLWPAVGVVLVLGAAATLWMTSATIGSFDGWGDIEHSPSGRWAFVTGADTMRGSLPATFLVNTASKEAERLPDPWVSAQFSRDGRVAAWRRTLTELPRWRPTDRRTWHRDARIAVRRLEPGAKTALLPVTLDWSENEPLLSDDGSRIVVIGSFRLRVFETASGKLLAAARLGQGSSIAGVYFAAPSRIRFIEQRVGKETADLLEWNTETRTIVRTGSIPVEKQMVLSDLTMSADGTLLYLSRRGVLVDAVTGAARANLAMPVKYTRQGGMMNDGTVVVARDSRVHIFNRDGKLLRAVGLPKPYSLAFVTAQLGDDKVLLFAPRVDREIDGSMFVVDVRTGAVVKTIGDRSGPAMRWSRDPRLVRYPLDSTFAATDYRQLTYWSLK